MSRWRPYWSPALLLVAGLSATSFYAFGHRAEARRVDAARFEIEANIVAQLIEQTMERYEERLSRLADVCSQYDMLPKRIWYFRRGTVTDLDGNLPGVIHVGYCPKVMPADYETHLERARQEWGETYQLEPPRTNRFALPIWQFWSRDGYVPLVPGSDFAGKTDSRPDFSPSLASGHGWVTTIPLQVAKKDGGMESGFWLALTLFRPDQETALPPPKGKESAATFYKRFSAFKRSAALGTMAAFVSTDRLIEEAYNRRSASRRVHVRLYADNEPLPGKLFNSQSVVPPNPVFHRKIVLKWYGSKYLLEITTTPLFEAESTKNLFWVILMSGTSLSVLGAALGGVATRAQVRQAQNLEEITAARDALAAAEKEREKLGHDLHDGAIQSLYAIQLGLSQTAETMAVTSPDAASILKGSRRKIDEVISELRGFIIKAESRGAANQPIQIDQMLNSIVKGLQPTTKTAIHLDLSPQAIEAVNGEVTLSLTQITRSLLSNVIRHANATHVNVSIERTSTGVRLRVADNGVGFDEAYEKTGGLGFKTLQARLTQLNGHFKVDSASARGTTVLVEIPLVQK
jgi:signal transduction histidine kinase